MDPTHRSICFLSFFAAPFENVETLVRALAKVENDGETEGAKLEATKNVEAEKLEF